MGISFDDYVQFDAVGLADLVRRGEVTSQELMDTAFETISALNPQLNAVIGVESDEAQQAVSRGLPSGRFTGVPFLIKDFLPREGHVITMGSVILHDYVAESTHEIANRIQAAGLITLGRTNMSELGLLPNTEPALFGPTQNPRAAGRSPGGSSGGSAAAVAAGIVPMAHAADGGGSIRIPASACGLFGLKPSRGRNPGAADDPPEGFVEHHVLTRTVRDSAAYLDAICGATPSDRWSIPDPQQPYEELIRREPPSLRIALMFTDFSNHPAHEECAAAVRKAARVSEDLGHRVEEVARPSIDAEKFNNAFAILWSASAGYFFKRIQLAIKSGTDIGAPRWAARPLQKRWFLDLAVRCKDRHVKKPLVESITRRLAAFESQLTPADLWNASVNLQVASRTIVQFLQDYDMILTPVMGDLPWPIGFLNKVTSREQLREQLHRYVGYTPICNAAGMPAMSVPIYETSEGIPVGAHFIAAPGREDLLLQLASQIEQSHAWGSQKQLPA